MCIRDRSSVSPVLKILNSNEIELLARKLPAGVLEKHIEHDNDPVSYTHLAKRKYAGVVIDCATIDEIMLILVKGERK